MRKGLTLIEVIVVMAIVALLAALTSFNLLSGRRQAEKRSVVEQVVSDMRSQQSRAMVGDSLGASFGIHFANNTYTLFTGATFNAADASNFVVTLDNNIEFTTTFLGNNIVFTPVSGEVTNYVLGSDTVTIIDATDTSYHILHINQYGVVDTKT